LEADGLIERRPGCKSGGWEYHRTKACEELGPILQSIGHWGQRWVRSRLSPGDLHPGELMWYIMHHFVIDQLPQQRVTIYVEFSDVRQMKRWWFVLENQKVDLCLQDPGHPIDISIFTDLLTLTQIYMGAKSFSAAVSLGKMTIDGSNSLTRHIWKWFGRSGFAPAERVA
jgi:hypothetical protein